VGLQGAIVSEGFTVYVGVGSGTSVTVVVVLVVDTGFPFGAALAELPTKIPAMTANPTRLPATIRFIYIPFVFFI
jgi:hypothetical protein